MLKKYNKNTKNCIFTQKTRVFGQKTKGAKALAEG